jgi:hypothetical protein
MSCKEIWAVIDGVISTLTFILLIWLSIIKPKKDEPVIQISHTTKDGDYFRNLPSDVYINKLIGNYMFSLGLEIRNIGRKTAHEVIARIMDVKVINDKTNKKSHVLGFNPIGLFWASREDIGAIDLSPKAIDYLYFCIPIEIHEQKRRIVFISQKQGNKFYKFFLDRGTYEVDIVVYSDDAATTSKKYSIVFAQDLKDLKISEV